MYILNSFKICTILKTNKQKRVAEFMQEDIMDYKEAREYIQSLEGRGMVFGLETMRTLMLALDNPQEQLKFIHIAGTNGKGSVLAYLSTILKESGYRTGRYCSPALFSYEEKIQVNEENIPKEMVAAGITKIRQVIEEQKIMPTVFEIETALAFWYFKETACDIVVLETGLGGDLDATNIITTTLCSIITSISFDHKKILGDTLEEIAAHKAGIIKPTVPVVMLKQSKSVEQVIQKRCRDLNCQRIEADGELARVLLSTVRSQVVFYKEYEKLITHLLGTFQKDNIAIVIETVKELRKLGYSITDEQLRNGIANTKWRGRMELICKSPLIFMDGAHNPDGVCKLKRSLEQFFTGAKYHFIIGVLADKDYPAMLETLLPKAKDVITITPNSERALPAEQLKTEIKKINPLMKVKVALSLEEAWNLTVKNKNEISVFCGSLSFFGELDQCVQKWMQEEH